MFTTTAIMTLNSLSGAAAASTVTLPIAVRPAPRVVRRTGTTVPAYFLGRPRHVWTAALLLSRAEHTLAA